MELYNELNTGEHPDVRLIILEGIHEKSNEIVCRLETVRFSDSLEYRALSYCWGEAGSQSSIICNGVRCLITNNLDGALRCLLRKGKADNLPLSFWIDAICINQDNNEEKGWQVMLMGDIYRQAVEVIVWLGPASDDSDFAFEVFNRLYSQEVAQKDKAPERNWGPVLKGYGHVIASRGIYTLVRELDAVQAILKRPWWSRTWIIQEIAMARRVTVFCGDAVIDWNALDVGVTACLKRPQAELFVDLTTAHYAGMLFEARRTAMYRQYEGATHAPSFLVYLLSRFRWSMATNPRDKVYGLLGLASVEQGNPLTKVSYSDDLESCYRTAILDIIRFTGSLDVLQLCNKLPGLERYISDSPQTFPSWIPDLRLDGSCVDPGTELRYFGPLLGLQSWPGITEALLTTPDLHARVFRASDGSTEYNPFVQDMKALIVNGFTFDTIKSVGEMQRGFEKQRNPHDIQQFDFIRQVKAGTWTVGSYFKLLAKSCEGVARDVCHIGEDNLLIASWKRLALSQREGYPAGGSLAHAFVSTLYQGALGSDPGRTLALYEADWKRTLGRVDTLDQSFLLKRLSQKSKSRLALAGLVNSTLTFFKGVQTPLEGTAVYQCFAVTEMGYFALLPPETQEGDKIALFKGGPVPFVVRQKIQQKGELAWELIGACYVHGIMHGEQWDAGRCQPIRLV